MTMKYNLNFQHYYCNTYIHSGIMTNANKTTQCFTLQSAMQNLQSK